MPRRGSRWSILRWMRTRYRPSRLRIGSWALATVLAGCAAAHPPSVAPSEVLRNEVAVEAEEPREGSGAGHVPEAESTPGAESGAEPPVECDRRQSSWRACHQQPGCAYSYRRRGGCLPAANECEQINSRYASPGDALRACRESEHDCAVERRRVCVAFECRFARGREQCLAREGCAFDEEGCRESNDPCDRVEYSRDESGEMQCSEPGCAFDGTFQVCRTYEPIEECPETAEEAGSLAVNCNIQPDFSCDYPAERVEYFCRGSRRIRAESVVQRRWTRWPDFDEHGCPQSRRAMRRRCSRARNDICRSLEGIHRCVQGRWRFESDPVFPG